jgi:acyl-coenzyme A synthetase/AMP-(fatty) acid ligase/acyl carrier protein
LVKEQVTVLNQTPSAFRQLIQAETNLGPSPHLALRYVIFGGEALEVRSLKPWFDRHGDQTPRLVNMYGITETTVHVTYQPLSSEDLTSASVIGRPLPDLQVYILDRNLEPVPIGVPGELYVGGGGVARGYLNRPDLTTERFVAHPFSKASRARLYKTGDRGRFLANGAIEYLGRMDNQVQLRGFRIEPGEIEALLAQHPAVAGAVAVMREDEPEDNRLVAYVVPHEPSAPSPGELREFLLQKIPSYMVPGSFVVLKQLPLTANGKVDKRALPAPETADRAQAMVHVAPSSKIQQRIARIWQDVLNLDEVGIQDNFFDLGGHSLLLMRVHNELQSKLGQPVSVLDLIQFPTIEALAGYLDPEKSESTVLADEDEEEMKRISEGKRRLMRLGRRRQSGKKA